MNRTNYEYIPRFSFEISEDTKARADELLNTHGVRKAVMTPILNDLLDLIEEHGQIVIGALLDEAAKPREIIKSMARAERRSSHE
jgi:hypothetical protein